MTQETQKKNTARRSPPVMGILFLLVALAFILMRWKSGREETAETTGVDTQAAAAQHLQPPATAKNASASAVTPVAGAAPGTDTALEKDEDEDETPREKAVARWEKLVDEIMDLTEAPSLKVAEDFKKNFAALDAEDQEDSIDYALNLLPDEQFPALYLILFDKRQNPDILDAIFSDALNRDESIKNPIMIELRKDKEHPMFFESARILDVIED